MMRYSDRDMAGTVMLNTDLLPEFDQAGEDVPIQVGPQRRVAHRGTFVPPDGEPIWPLADDYDVTKMPLQGRWTERDYLSLGVGKAIELTYGRLEFLPVATARHQTIVLDLVFAVQAVLKPGRRGTVMFAPFPMDTLPGKYREPDVLVMLAENAGRMSNERWQGADLVVEVVSEDDPGRDYVQKRREYARCGVREYWIVDPIQRLILLLSLDGAAYREVGTYRAGEVAKSPLIDGFAVGVDDVFDAADATAVDEEVA